MKIIIKKTGEVKDVSFGYATNYLFPQGLAYEATNNKLNQLKADQERLVREKKQTQVKAQTRSQKLADKEVGFKVKKGEGKKIHGSITNLDIADKLGVDKTEVELDQPIKELGEYEVKVKLKGADPIKIKVIVIAE